MIYPTFFEDEKGNGIAEIMLTDHPIHFHDSYKLGNKLYDLVESRMVITEENNAATVLILKLREGVK